MKRAIIGIALASTVMLSSGMTNVYADSPEERSNNEIEQVIKEETIDFLYVIDKEKYKEILDKNTALVTIKDRLLVVNSKKISEDELSLIDSAEEFYVIGESTGELKSLKDKENFKSQLLGKTRVKESVKLAKENGVNKDIIIAHSSSLADSFTGLQVSRVKDMNLILVDDKMSDEVKSFIKENGKGKEIQFIEGEKLIDDKLQKSILKLAGNEKYKINKEEIIKISSSTKKEKEVTEVSEVKGEDKIQIPKNGEEFFKKESDGSTNKNLVEINDKMKKTVANVANKRTEENRELITGKEKLISLDYEQKESKENLSEVITNETVEVVKDDEKKSEAILKKADSDEKLSAHKLTITKSNPASNDTIKKLKDDDKEFYIVPKKADEKFIREVIDGKHGSGPERKENLELDGYDYEKVQAEVEKVLEAERKAEEAKQAKIAKEKAEKAEKARIAKEKEAEKARAEAQARAEAEERAQARAEAEERAQAEERSQAQASTVSQNQAQSAQRVSRSNERTGSYIEASSEAKPAQSSPQTVSKSTSGDAQAFISSLVSMKGWTYSQSNRMQNGYADCTSIILKAMLNSGATSSSANLTTRSIAGDSRFHQVSMSSLQPGDILWAPGHTEVYLGGNSTFGAFKPGKPAGYASGVNRFQKAYRINGF